MTQYINKHAIITENLEGKRLDQAAAMLFPEHSRMAIKNWINNDQLMLDGKPAKPRDKVTNGQEIVINAELEEVCQVEPQDIPLNIIFEDDELLIINKPSGLVVHPGAGNKDKTLVNALIHHCPQLNTLPRAGLIHRIDKDTTGLLVIAKTLTAHTFLTNELQERKLKRCYEAIVVGHFISGGTISEPIGRHKTKRTSMAVTPTGKPATTHYRVAAKYRAHTRLDIELETGRTHQIRVHMAHLKHPIVGDKTYSGRLGIAAGTQPELAEYLRHFNRQALHAKSLTLRHPKTLEAMTFTAPTPTDIQDLISLLECDTNIENNP